jgi:YD repeat-containing protein
MRKTSFLLFLVLVACSSASVLCQSRPFGSYDNYSVDSIDLETLNVHLNIPIFQKPGRGIPINLFYTYDSGNSGAWSYPPLQWNAGQPWQDPSTNITGSLSFDVQTAPCSDGDDDHIETYYQNFSYTDPNGGQHSFPDLLISRLCPRETGAPDVTSDTAADGTGLLVSNVVVINTGENILAAKGTITLPNGAQFNITPGGFAQGVGVLQQDMNGNQTSITNGVLTDTLGLNAVSYVVLNNSSTNSSAAWQYTDSNGHPQQVVVNYEVYALTDQFGTPGVSAVNGYIGCSGANTAEPFFIQSIVYPDGTSYQFTYETFAPGNDIDGNPTGCTGTDGRITSVTLPTGGVIHYTYSGSLTTSTYSLGLTRTTTDGSTTYSVVEAPGDQPFPNPAGPLNGQFPGAYPRATQTTKVDAAGNTSVITFGDGPMGGGAFGSPASGFETDRKVYNGQASGTPILWEQRCYNGYQLPCASEGALAPPSQNYTQYYASNFPLPSGGTYGDTLILTSDVYDSYNGGPAKRVSSVYNTPFSGPTEVDEYDFGATSPTRKTLTQYFSIGSYPTNQPSQVTVENGTGTIAAQTTYGYDQYSLVPTSGLPQHVSMPTSGRGNLTSVQRLLASSNTNITSTMTYDDAGQMQTATDPNSNTTTYSYEEADAYISEETLPPNSGLSLLLNYHHDANTGLLLNSWDLNNNETSFTYDAMMRPVTASYPDGGQTTVQYNPSGYPQNTVLTHVLMCTGLPSCSPQESSGQTSTTLMVYDGLGRPSTSEVISDPSGPVYSVASYNSVGLLGSVTNPYRTTNDFTYGPTTYSYDALARETLQTDSDGINTESMSYSGNTMTYTDENGNQRKQTADGLGRVTAVVEPGTLTTNYYYDVLNDTLSIIQLGNSSSDAARTRSFVYDSLSRLQSETNPETGFTSYTYYPNGSLLTKTSPAVNATSGTQTIGYCYDTLNRIIYKFYTASFSCTNPSGYAASYTYDVSGNSRAQNTLGQLTDEKSYAGTTLVSERQPYSYDMMGRLLNEVQCNLGSCTSAAFQSQPGYQYDVAGNLTKVTDGITPNPTTPGSVLTFTGGYDPAGRLQTLNSNWIDPTHPGTLFSPPSGQGTQCPNSVNAQYAPFGLVNAALGSGLQLNRSYDKRLRMTCERDSLVGSGPATTGSAAITITGAEQNQ